MHWTGTFLEESGDVQVPDEFPFVRAAFSFLRLRPDQKAGDPKDAKVTKGLFTFYQTDEKVYLEIEPEQFDKLYLLSLTCESGLGEGGFYGAEMCGESTWGYCSASCRTPSGRRPRRPGPRSI